MPAILKIRHEFIKSIPIELEDGILYISMEYAMAAHKCACGCGNIVYTPLSPTDWRLSYDGESVSLAPSIGNWSFHCKSHYWIEHGEIQWGRQWNQERIDRNRLSDRKIKQSHYKSHTDPQNHPVYDKKPSWLVRLWHLLFRS